MLREGSYHGFDAPGVVAPACYLGWLVWGWWGCAVFTEECLVDDTRGALVRSIEGPGGADPEGEGVGMGQG